MDMDEFSKLRLKGPAVRFSIGLPARTEKRVSLLASRLGCSRNLVVNVLVAAGIGQLSSSQISVDELADILIEYSGL